jgi:hypothetical protein
MTIASNPPIELPIEQLSNQQKWYLYGQLRRQLGIAEKTEDIPEWHLAILEERDQRLKTGEATLMELDDFVAEMRRRMP